MITSYKEYILENNFKPLQKVKNLMDNLHKMILNWFTTGSLSKQGLNLQNIDTSFTNDITDKTKIITFDDSKFYYQIVLVASIDDLFKNSKEPEEEQLKDISLQIKKYDLDNQSGNSLEGTLIDRWEGTIKIKEFTEDFIIDKISQMQDKTLSIEDTALDNTQIEETTEETTEEKTQEL